MESKHPNGPTESPIEWVSASEIAEYTYCARAHWLTKVHGVLRSEVAAAQLSAGVATHRKHGAAIAAWPSPTSRARRLRPALLTLIVVFVVVLSLLALLLSRR